jgi:threonyl-tRNA synthetase
MTMSYDHRDIGREQGLFFFHEYSPGSCFFYPHGVRIYNKLLDFLKNEYQKRNYQEVMTPILFNTELWKQSGHHDHYKDNMYYTGKDNKYGLKPMNCPSHCLIFNSITRSYKELPLRLADFGVLHRNEASGSLTGLTRVRKFQQDDAHIFCKFNDLKSEILNVLDFINFVYIKVFNLKLRFGLSTRPDSYIGELDDWDKAELILTECLQESNIEFFVKDKDGAFYGPKIDIQIMDNLDRYNQCATIQLDFQLPIKFDLLYNDEHGNKVRPIMIHRAILGSIERFIALLCENYKGRWPFWISPRQIMIIPINKVHRVYCDKLKNLFKNYYVDIDLSDDTLKKRILNSKFYTFVLVVGDKEVLNQTVSVRYNNVTKTYSVDSFNELIYKMNNHMFNI